MIHGHASLQATRRATPPEEERQGRRLSLLLVGGVVLWSLSYIAWKLWVVETLGDRLEGLAVSVQAPPSLQVGVAEIRVDRHQGPGDSAYFDMTVLLRARRGGGGEPASVEIEAALADEAKKPFFELEPVTLTDVRLGDDRVHRLSWSPVPKPIAERAHYLLIRARPAGPR